MTFLTVGGVIRSSLTLLFEITSIKSGKYFLCAVAKNGFRVYIKAADEHTT